MPIHYRRVVRCPVCKAQIDVWEGPDKEPSGMGAAMCLGPSRAQHGKESPQCRKHEKWSEGWTFDEPEEIVIPDTPLPPPQAAKVPAVHYGKFNVSWRYDLGDAKLTGMDCADLDAHAVARALEMWGKGFREGELNYLFGDREIRGWWTAVME